MDDRILFDRPYIYKVVIMQKSRSRPPSPVPSTHPPTPAYPYSSSHRPRTGTAQSSSRNVPHPSNAFAADQARSSMPGDVWSSLAYEFMGALRNHSMNMVIAEDRLWDLVTHFVIDLRTSVETQQTTAADPPAHPRHARTQHGHYDDVPEVFIAGDADRPTNEDFMPYQGYDPTPPPAFPLAESDDLSSLSISLQGLPSPTTEVSHTSDLPPYSNAEASNDQTPLPQSPMLLRPVPLPSADIPLPLNARSMSTPPTTEYFSPVPMFPTPHVLSPPLSYRPPPGAPTLAMPLPVHRLSCPQTGPLHRRLPVVDNDSDSTEGSNFRGQPSFLFRPLHDSSSHRRRPRYPDSPIYP